jgi:septal ring factor EnvC (AmiA/AmiB activator)
MPRKGVTYDQVANAAQTIKNRGLEPTIHAVRTELGNAGSYSTISQHLARWRSETADKVDAKALPPEAENAALTAITTLWNIAVKYATQETAAVRQEAEDNRQRLERELAEAKEEIARLEAAQEMMTATLDEQEQALRTQRHALAQIEGEKAALERAYQDLLQHVKPPHDTEPKAPDTKPAHPAPPPASRGNKRAAAR